MCINVEIHMVIHINFLNNLSGNADHNDEFHRLIGVLLGFRRLFMQSTS